MHAYVCMYLHSYVHTSRLTVVSQEAKEEAAHSAHLTELETHTSKDFIASRVLIF